jgi:two-component sensor histidine kinase
LRVRPEDPEILEALIRGQTEENEKVRTIEYQFRNGLQTILSMLSLQLGMEQTEPARSAVESVRRRIEVLSIVHDSQLEYDPAMIDLAKSIGEITRRIIQESGSLGPGVSLRCDSMPVPYSVALCLGFSAGELVANAIRHAWPEDRIRGTMEISLRSTVSGGRLTVSDDGRGMGSAPKGLGLTLAELMSEQIEGRFSILSEAGTVAVIDFPLG